MSVYAGTDAQAFTWEGLSRQDLAEMGDLEGLRSQERRHATTSGFQMVESDLPRQVPVELSPGLRRTGC